MQSRKSRNTWSNRPIWPWSTEWSRAKANRVLPRERTGHIKHPLPITQEKTVHMYITRWSTLKSDWLYSLQPKMEKLFIIFFKFHFILFFPFIFISWRLITLQYYSGFCHTLTWISHGFTCVPHPEPPFHLPPHPIPLGLPSAPAPSTCLMHPTWAGDLFHPR